MKKRVRFILLLIGTFLILTDPFIYADGPGTTSCSFLRFGTGARAVGMGEAFTGVASDVNAIYWNPGGLSKLSNKEISCEYKAWLEDIKIGNLVYGQPIGRGAFAGGITYLGATDRRFDIDRKYLGRFENSYHVIAIGYTYNGVGLKLKYIKGKLDTEEAYGLAADIGLLYRAFNNLTLGAVVKNLGLKPMKFIEDEDPMPINYIIGIAHKFNNLLLALDINKPIDNKFRFNLGAEYWIGKIIALRTGYKFKEEGNEEGFGLTAGLGFKFKNYQFDYAYVPYGNLGDAHRYSLIIRF